MLHIHAATQESFKERPQSRDMALLKSFVRVPIAVLGWLGLLWLVRIGFFASAGFLGYPLGGGSVLVAITVTVWALVAVIALTKRTHIEECPNCKAKGRILDGVAWYLCGTCGHMVKRGFVVTRSPRNGPGS